jgi:hypothetical protein
MIEMGNAYKNFSGKTLRGETTRRPRRKLKEDIKLERMWIGVFLLSRDPEADYFKNIRLSQKAGAFLTIEQL